LPSRPGTVKYAPAARELAIRYHIPPDIVR
jgi:hypothetical protein